MARLRISVCRGLLYLAVGLAVCELFILNITIIYACLSIHGEMSKLLSGNGDRTFMDKLLSVPIMRNIVYQGKSGGFVNLMKNSVDRVFIVSDRRETVRAARSKPGSISSFDTSEISYVAIDVSSAGEALYLIRRIKQRGDIFSKNYQNLIIDIGANDGLMSSNSFNFIQLGWDAILVEPQTELLHQAKENIERYTDPYNQGRQRVHLVNAVIGQHDGLEDFVMMKEDMESHIVTESMVNSGLLIVKVPSMTVSTFAKKYKVPEHFGILSIDAEGIGDKILHQWIDAGFQPAYIIYEALHNREPMSHTATYLKRKGYRFLIKLGWNFIYEHQFVSMEEEGT